MTMDTDRTRALVGTLVLLPGSLLVAGLLLWGTESALQAVRAPGPATIDPLVALAAAGLAWVVLAWLTAVTALALLSAAAGGVGCTAHRVATALSPALCRRLVAAVLGLSVVTAPAVLTAPAAAATVAVPAPAPVSAQLDRPVAAAPQTRTPQGWTPDRPVVTPRLDPARAAVVRLVTSPPRAGLQVRDEVVVRRGDTLWDLTARHLGPGATAADVATEWPRWYDANRPAIGADPDLLLPGTLLVPPPAS